MISDWIACLLLREGDGRTKSGKGKERKLKKVISVTKHGFIF